MIRLYQYHGPCLWELQTNLAIVYRLGAPLCRVNTLWTTSTVVVVVLVPWGFSLLQANIVAIRNGKLWQKATSMLQVPIEMGETQVLSPSPKIIGVLPDVSIYFSRYLGGSKYIVFFLPFFGQPTGLPLKALRCAVTGGCHSREFLWRFHVAAADARTSHGHCICASVAAGQWAQWATKHLGQWPSYVAALSWPGWKSCGTWVCPTMQQCNMTWNRTVLSCRTNYWPFESFDLNH